MSWSHFIEILPLKQPLEREFYAEMCRTGALGVHLRERIGSQLYLRSAVAKKPEGVIAKELSHLREGGQMTPDLVFPRPLHAGLLGLPDGYSERDLESAILRDGALLLELGQVYVCGAAKAHQRGADDFIWTCCSTTGTCAAWWRWS